MAVRIRGGRLLGYPIPRKKIPIPGYGNPGDFELKAWDPHPGIFENIPGFPGVSQNPKKSQFFRKKLLRIVVNLINSKFNEDFPTDHGNQIEVIECDSRFCSDWINF